MSDRLPAFLRARLAGRDTLRQAVDNSFWLFCDQFLRMGLNLVVGVWVARYLGPTEFGLLNYAVAVVTIVGSCTSLGINAVVVRELVRVPAETNAWMGTAFFLKSAGASVGFLVCVGLAWRQPFANAQMPALIMVVAAGMFLQTLDVIDLFFQSRGESRVSAWVHMGACGVTNAIKVALILNHASLLALGAAGVIEIGLSALGWLWAAKLAGGRPAVWHCERRRAAVLLAESWPLAVSGLAVNVQAYADQVMLGAMLGGGELGRYAAAFRVVSVFSFVPMVVQTVAAPEITRAKRDDGALYWRRLYNLYRLMFVLFLAVALPLILLGAPVTTWLYGASYTGAGLLLPWLAFRLFFTNFGVARSAFVTTEGLFRFALLTAVAGAVVNLLLNLALIPQWGARGAVLSSLVSFGVTIFALEGLQPQARANRRLMLRAMLTPWRRFSG